jgi:flagellar biosynthesis protein FlhB
MSNSSGQEKSEQPTDRRKKEARNKGTVAKSVDMISAAVFMSILVALPAVMSNGFKGFTHGFQTSLRVGALEPSLANINRITFAALIPMLPPLFMIMAVAMTVGLVGNFAQVGFNLSGESLKPNFNKINPANGLKRLFGKPAVFDMFKSLVKLFLFSFMVYTAIRDHWGEIGMIWALTPLGALGVIGGIIRTILIRVGVAWLALAVADYIFQKKQVNSQLMMTSRDEGRRVIARDEGCTNANGAKAIENAIVSGRRRGRCDHHKPDSLCSCD